MANLWSSVQICQYAMNVNEDYVHEIKVEVLNNMIMHIHLKGKLGTFAFVCLSMSKRVNLIFRHLPQL